MNQSFWNKLAGAKSKTLACTVVAALTVALLFMVCSKDEDDPPPTPPPAGVCDNGPTAECCAAQPSYQGCSTPPTDPCIANPTPGCPNYVNPCDANPDAQGCPGYCQANPNASECLVDGCLTSPTWPECDNYCDFYNNAPPVCQPEENCTTNPTMHGCPGFCGANPTHEECTIDPCEVNPYAQGCPGFCEINPTAAECGGPDPCATNPTPNCPGYCSANPTAPGCGGGDDKKYCRWNDNPLECYEINGPYSDTATVSEAACKRNYGEVVTDCNATIAQSFYCLWETGCAKIQDPDALKTDCGNPAGSESCPSGMTNKSGCVAYGKLFESLDACENYVPTGPEYYCYWPTGCAPIASPDVVDPANPGMTNKEVCSAYGKLFESRAECQAYTPPAVGYYCDYGPVETKPDGSKDKGCWRINKDNPTKADDCEWGTFITCTGTDRPGDGTCCAH